MRASLNKTTRHVQLLCSIPILGVFGRFIMDNPGAFAFSNDPHSSTTFNSTHYVQHWAKDVSLPSKYTKVKVQARAPLLPAQGGASPRGAVHRGCTKYGVVLHHSFAHLDAHVIFFFSFFLFNNLYSRVSKQPARRTVKYIYLCLSMDKKEPLLASFERNRPRSGSGLSVVHKHVNMHI